jgi:hypothetical protein
MKLLLILGSVIALPTFAASGGDLQASDLTGVSFWLVTAALLAATVFFFVERDQVSAKWKTSLTVSGLVTGNIEVKLDTTEVNVSTKTYSLNMYYTGYQTFVFDRGFMSVAY